MTTEPIKETCEQAFERWLRAGESIGNQYSGKLRLELWGAWRLAWEAGSQSGRGTFDVALIWLPGWVNGMNGLQLMVQLPFVPVEGMAIELEESFGGLPATLPYIDDVTWNVERQRFDCRIVIHWGKPDDEENDHRTQAALLKQGWVDLS